MKINKSKPLHGAPLRKVQSHYRLEEAFIYSLNFRNILGILPPLMARNEKSKTKDYVSCHPTLSINWKNFFFYIRHFWLVLNRKLRVFIQNSNFFISLLWAACSRGKMGNQTNIKQHYLNAKWCDEKNLLFWKKLNWIQKSFCRHRQLCKRILLIRAFIHIEWIPSTTKLSMKKVYLINKKKKMLSFIPSVELLDSK